MRVFVFTLALALAAVFLSGCKDKTAATGSQNAVEIPAPAGFGERETKIMRSLAECEDRVRDMTKGGDVSAQTAGDGVIVYEFMLNSGRRIWQSCSVQADGRYVHAVAFSDEALQ